MSTRSLTAFVTAIAIAASCGTPALAEPAPIDDGSGPRTVGEPAEDGSGTPGPSFDEPIDIPSVGSAPTHPGDDATDEELEAYDAAMRDHRQQMQARANAQGLEAARRAAKAYRECVARANENEVC